MAGSDAKYFQSTTKKGEVKDLADDLNSLDKNVVKDAVKKVIAAMTIGKDVSALFPHVIKSMQTDNIELKKLVYLYIISYARSHPDKAILVVNTFQKDAGPQTPNPLVRALAIRTMGCIRVDRITEYLCEPLSRSLNDTDPYVRKTAAMCVAKLYDINAELVEDRGFIERLRELISDSNPTVVANAVAALAEISESSNSDVFKITSSTLHKLLTALNECTEWGQVFILDSLARYEPSSSEAEDIVERVSPRLQHANAAVVMSAIRVVMKFLEFVSTDETRRTLSRKLAPPLVTLLSAEPEIQYVALRNIDLIVQKKPEILQREVRVFFCKYNDPVYVKMEKLEIMIKLCNDSNVDQVLLEFKEYAQEVDVDFVRKAVRSIGRCAIKLEIAAERCIRVLLDLIATKVNYVVQEAVIVIKDIFRRYPNRYEGIIVNLCENLDSLDEPEAKAAMIWIIGEYAERIEDAAERLESWVDTFEEETSAVQLQLLTAVVKLFLKRPDSAQDLVKRVLDLSTERSDNPDLRDRGYVYWRLLSTNPKAAKEVVVSKKPVISDETYRLPPDVLDTLIANIATLASVYQTPPETFVKGSKNVVFRLVDEDDISGPSDQSESEAESDSDEAEEDEEESDDEEDEDEDEDSEEDDEDEEDSEDEVAAASSAVDLLDLGGVLSSPSPPAPSTESTEPSTTFPMTKRFLVLPAAKGANLQISASFGRRKNTPFVELVLENQAGSNAPLTQVAVQFNDNYLGVKPVSPLLRLASPVAPASQGSGVLPLRCDGPLTDKGRPGLVQVAVKTNLGGVLYFTSPLPPHVFFDESGCKAKDEFVLAWKQLPAERENKLVVAQTSVSDIDAVVQRLAAINVFFMARLEVANKGTCVYASAHLRDCDMLIELTFGPELAICVKSVNDKLSLYTAKALQTFLA